MGFLSQIAGNFIKSQVIDFGVGVGATIVSVAIPIVGPAIGGGMITARKVYKVGKFVNNVSEWSQNNFDSAIDKLTDQGLSPEDAALILGSI